VGFYAGMPWLMKYKSFYLIFLEYGDMEINIKEMPDAEYKKYNF
jgi:hypothetical protein